MNYAELLSAAAAGAVSPAEADELLGRRHEAGGDAVDRSLAGARRFLIRLKQRSLGALGDGDFCAALREAVLTLGRLAMPEDVAALVRRDGESFGLSVENGREIVAEAARPGWFANPEFVRAAYRAASEPSMAGPAQWGDAYLKLATGFDAYRSFEQKVAVHTALTMPAGTTMLLTLPTGAGKSLITQMLAALAGGLTLLVVPTTALSDDQTRAARANLKASLPAEAVREYRGDRAGELAGLLKALSERTLRLLITSPEAIVRNQRLKEALLSAAGQGYLRHLVIDEAHVVQDWGARFRPDFQLLASIRGKMMEGGGRGLKTVLLTATVTEESVAYLKSLFSSEARWIEIRCDSLRKEPRYMVESCASEAELTARVLHYARTLPKPMLVYTTRPSDAQRWRSALREGGFENILTFTGLTEDAERKAILDMWQDDRLDILIATSAFGMGVDKRDVRTVLHVTLPESVNRFYQEVGRAGRDGFPCLSAVCYRPGSDADAVNRIVNSSVITVEKMLDRWFTMSGDANALREGDRVSLDPSLAPSSFTERERERRGARNRDWNLHVILFLARHGLLEFVDMTYDAARKAYAVVVRISDIELMQDKRALRAYLTPLRRIEAASARRGYAALQELVSAKRAKCVADYFGSLFPYAPPSCGGCRQHQDARYSDARFMLRKSVPLYPREAPPITSHHLWNGFPLLMILRENGGFRPEKAAAAALAVNDHGVGCWIADEIREADAARFRGLTLRAEEAEFLLERHPSLLECGAVLTPDDDPRHQARTQRLARQLLRLGSPVALYMEGATRMYDSDKEMVQELNGSVIGESDLE